MADNDDLVTARLYTIVRRTFHLGSDTVIGPQTSSVDVDGWDSLSHSILIMNTEDEFAIDLPSDRVYELANIGELAELIRATLNARRPDERTSQP